MATYENNGETLKLPDIEQKYVVDFYNSKAEHFSETRFKSWPAITEFVGGLPSNSTILDAGCGNGKNMTIRDDINWTGCDISEGLLNICRERGFENVFWADLRDISRDDNTFDNVISVAVVHHISTFEGRVKACQELIRVCKPGGKIFIQVWQDLGVNNDKFQPINDDGDYYVTWKSKDGTEVTPRFYHMFKEDEIERLIDSLKDIKVIKTLVEVKNHVIILEKV